jgi:prepilin-type N-terminal cleavage/methylation domain-containing protein
MTPILRPNSETGFTLIELLVVLTIMGLVVIAIAPNLGRHPSALTRASAVRQILRLSEHAHTQAQLSGTTAGLSLDQLPAGVRWVGAAADGFQPATPLFFADGSASPGQFLDGRRALVRLDALTGTARADE